MIKCVAACSVVGSVEAVCKLKGAEERKLRQTIGRVCSHMEQQQQFEMVVHVCTCADGTEKTKKKKLKCVRLGGQMCDRKTKWA